MVSRLNLTPLPAEILAVNHRIMPHPEIQKFPKNFATIFAKELRLTKEIASVKEKMAKTNDSNVIAANEKRIEQLKENVLEFKSLLLKLTNSTMLKLG